jgi:hypothetical protein
LRSLARERVLAEDPESRGTVFPSGGVKTSNMLRSVISVLSLFIALGAAPAFAEPTPPPPAAAPSTAPSAAAEPTPAPAQSAAPAASSAPAPATSTVPAPAPSVEQGVAVRAMDWLRRLQTGDLDRNQLTVEFNRALTPERVKLIVEQLGTLGKLKSYAFAGEAVTHGIHAYQFTVDFAAAQYLYLFEVDQKDKVAGMLLTPPKK